MTQPRVRVLRGNSGRSASFLSLRKGKQEICLDDAKIGGLSPRMAPGTGEQWMIAYETDPSKKDKNSLQQFQHDHTIRELDRIMETV